MQRTDNEIYNESPQQKVDRLSSELAANHARLTQTDHQQRLALSRQCDNAAHSVCAYPDCCTCTCHQPPASHLTAPQLAVMRATILRVIDDGDPDWQVGGQNRWLFYDGNEDLANSQRLDFCDRIQELITAATKQSSD